MKYLRNNKGITLAALVVTIIVLLILSGITISMITGGDGVINQAGNARDQSKIQEEKEQISIAAANAMGKSKWGDLEEHYLKKEFENKDANVTKVGNKFKIEYTNGRTYFVDENANVRLKGQNEVDISEIQENASKYFGYDVINYKTKSDDLDYIEWQLYYAGKLDNNDATEDEHIYLIAKDYVKADNLPTVIKNGRKVTKEVTIDEGTIVKEVKPTKITEYKANFDDVLEEYQGSDSIKNPKLQKLNMKYFEWLSNNNTTSRANNMNAVAYMLDTITWGDYAGTNAEYAIGGSTIELLFKAYNKYKNQNNLYQAIVTEKNGYKISMDNGQTWNYNYNNMIELDQKEGNTMVLDSPYIVSSYYPTQVNQCFLASPSSSQYSSVFYSINGISFQGGISGGAVYSSSNVTSGFRPVICLKAGISLELTKDSNGNDAFRIVE